MIELKIGMATEDGSIRILDEDRLCYKVLSRSKSAEGVRTISKELLAEWVPCVEKNPTKTSFEVRDILSGKSDIDKFEYGYAATLKKMAEMILGRLNVVLPESDFSEEFVNWFAEHRGKGKTNTAEKYLGYFRTITDPYQEPTNSYWHGLYKVVYGKNAEKKVVAIGTLDEFAQVYGDLIVALEKKVKGEGMVDSGFQKAIDWFWKPEVKPHTCVTSALNAYRDFLEWREKQVKEVTADEMSCADRLTVALKLFQEHRLDEDWVKVLKRDGYEGLHERYAAMNPETLRGMNAAEFDAWVDRELWAARTFFCGQNIKKLSDADKKAFCEFIAATKMNFRLLSNYLGKDAKLPNGVGPVVATELLMKFHPLDYCNFNVLMLQGLKVLGLVESDKMPNVVSVAMYQMLMGHAAMLLEKLTDAGVPRRFDEGQDAKPDCITVNEFLWWVKTHQDLIKEEIMKQNQIKAEPEKLKADGKKKLSDLIAGGPDSLMTMLTAALLAKPFAILAGASGTGKSRMVKKLAYMTCNADQLRSEKDETPGNYCMVAVKPNWHDSSELLGYRSAISESHEYITPDFIKFVLRAHAFPNTPFFVCLDEMNLAPVEQYFAEFLSACESVRNNSEGEWVSDPLILPGEFDNNVANLAPEYSLPDACVKRIDERGLYIPRNLFVVGTVNMDDTTHQFSRKVLDRAMTLMMDDVDFGTLQDAQYEKLTNDLLMNGDDIKKFIDRGEFEGGDLEEVFKDMLGRLQAALKESPFAIGYRFAIESVLYHKALALLGVDAAALDATAADHMALMKILPRITGTLTERDAVLKSLTSFFASLGEHKQSGSRLEKMKTAARQNGDYISFWP